VDYSILHHASFFALRDCNYGEATSARPSFVEYFPSYHALTSSLQFLKILVNLIVKGKVKDMKKLVLLFVLSLVFFLSCSGSRPASLGVTQGRLAPCPDAPHCVSSQSEDESHRMEPLCYTTSQAEAQEKLLTILRSMKRTSIISIKDEYLHAECASAIFRYVDDVEFYFNDEQKLIHFRSSSRLGYDDMGVNRRRMKKIRETFLGN
jgi:uncharacterized protein (DUF1499 family)